MRGLPRCGPLEKGPWWSTAIRWTTPGSVKDALAAWESQSLLAAAELVHRVEEEEAGVAPADRAEDRHIIRVIGIYRGFVFLNVESSPVAPASFRFSAFNQQHGDAVRIDDIKAAEDEREVGERIQVFRGDPENAR